MNMTSVSRGRGWATAKNREAVLRRPGPIVSQKNPDHLKLIGQIDSLSIYNATPMSKIDEIDELIRDAARQKGLRSVFDTLHTQALEDRQFGIKLAMLFSYNQISDQQDENGTKLRSILLSTLQKDYERKDETKEQCMMHYLNAMSLLGEVYYQVRLATGEPLPLIGVPLLEYMKALLQSASEEDIELVATQLSLNGKKIRTSNQAELERFLIHVRTVLVNRNLSSQSRGMLLLAVDLANQLYEPLSGDLQAFYLAQLGDEAMMQLQRYQNVKNIVKPKDQMNDTARNTKYDSNRKERLSNASSGVGTLAKSMNVEESANFEISPKSYEQNSSGMINSQFVIISPQSQPSLPRAIRGLGIRENRKENTGDRKVKGKKDKLTDEQVWSSKQHNSNKSWGHDDRFDRDYEQDRHGARSASNNTDNSQFSN
ncbi:uncharacterized protein LOC107226726 [Neodiprion lecontei]|uniref:Uncharacterized protein LOC107226726 n=1 Tax=Neodiprion lecontei TaxID=441921 RepID=A0A6J0C9M9_NEOLC|nr:uncharacterized protein LOC107226726 [Neodiprion lecontei]